MPKQNFMIYGSYGYSGNLIDEYACSQGLKPVLAGRNKEKLQKQAARLGLAFQHFDIDDLEAIKRAITSFITVIHCAGPFIDTYKNMVEACLETHTHYVDITGEYQVIEALSKLNDKAVNSGIMLLPSAGFDVVPSDCLARYLKNKLPDATELNLAIYSTDSSLSRGTAKTFANGFGQGVMIRENGLLKPIALGERNRVIVFGEDKRINCTAISWGDLSSAWWSTGIPNITTYMSASRFLLLIYKLVDPIKSIFTWSFIQKFIQKRINRMPEGPSANELAHSKSYVYGEVKNDVGKKFATIITMPNGYRLTALSTILIINKILSGNAPKGFQTPSTAYGPDLILEIPACKREEILFNSHSN